MISSADFIRPTKGRSVRDDAPAARSSGYDRIKGLAGRRAGSGSQRIGPFEGLPCVSPELPSRGPSIPTGFSFWTNVHKLADVLHPAVAIEGRCNLFLTNDHRLGGFLALTVEVLP